MYLSIFNSFRVIRCLSQCVSPKIAIFYHIFVSPGDAPGAITLAVVQMERELDAYKLSRCMCQPNYNRFWDRARYLWKGLHFIIPPCIRRPRYGGSRRNIAIPFGVEKTRMVGLPDGKKIEDMYNRLGTIPACDRQTDGQTDILPRHIRAMHTRRAVKTGTGLSVWHAIWYRIFLTTVFGNELDSALFSCRFSAD